MPTPTRCTGTPDCPCVMCVLHRSDPAPKDPPPPPAPSSGGR